MDIPGLGPEGPPCIREVIVVGEEPVVGADCRSFKVIKDDPELFASSCLNHLGMQ